MTPTGLLFDIQRFSVHDGPGIRTTVFFQGCSARCSWCHNPESLRAAPQLLYDPSKCIGCGRCVPACATRAHAMTDEGLHALDRSRCVQCGACASACYTGALTIAGRTWTLQDVLDQVLDDLPYYRQSGGGVTLSGGEPALQTDFAQALLTELQSRGVHTCMQTAGFYPWERLERLLPHLDLLMFDVKALNEATYREHIHADRDRALDNLARAGRSGVPLIVRTPVIPGLNDAAEEIADIARLAAGLPGLEYYMLLPYHPMGKSKYDTLGSAFTSFDVPTRERMGLLEEIAARYVRVYNNENGFVGVRA